MLVSQLFLRLFHVISEGVASSALVPIPFFQSYWALQGFQRLASPHQAVSSLTLRRRGLTAQAKHQLIWPQELKLYLQQQMSLVQLSVSNYKKRGPCPTHILVSPLAHPDNRICKERWGKLAHHPMACSQG